MVPLYIPTRGRIDRQITIKQFHKDLYGERVWLVTTKDEKHKGLPVIHLPDKYATSIATKRQWIADYASERFPFHAQCDDDTFIARRDGAQVNSKKLLVYFDNMMKHFDTVGVMAGGHRAFSQNKPEFQYNRAGGGVFRVYRNKFLGQSGIRFDQVRVLEDVHVMLGMLEAGYDYGITHRYLFTNHHRTQSKAGGTLQEPVFQDIIRYKKSIEKMASLHDPKLAELVPTTPPKHDTKPTPASYFRFNMNIYEWCKSYGRKL